MSERMTEEAAKALRAPFPESAIGKLPRKGTDGLDYVGHAAVTDRLLAVDPLWTWEPLAFDELGGPLVIVRDSDAVLWLRLTVCGVTRLGVGIVRADAFELEKQLISDGLRNAAMRFGVALDLWAKETLHASEPAAPIVPEGWDTHEQAAEAHRVLRDRIANLPAEDRAVIRERAGGWPLSREAFAEIEALVAIAEGAEEPF